MGSGQHLGADLEFAHERERLCDPILQFLFYPRKNDIPDLNCRGLKGERDAQKEKNLTMLNPLTLE